MFVKIRHLTYLSQLLTLLPSVFTIETMEATQTILIQQMTNACEKMSISHWESIKPYAEHEFKGLLMKLEWINQMKRQKEMTTEQARVYIDIHKNTMRTRLMTLPNITIIDAEHIINTGIDSIRKELYSQMEWVIIKVEIVELRIWIKD